jgi:hypothetical protein
MNCNFILGTRKLLLKQMNGSKTLGDAQASRGRFA